MPNTDRTVRNWKNFCSLVVYELGVIFDIANSDDIRVVKTTIGDGMGVGIKFDGSFAQSDTTIINSIVHKLRSALNKRSIQVNEGWGILCDDDYVDTTLSTSSDDEDLMFVLSISGDLSSGKVPFVSEVDIKALGNTFAHCLDNLQEDVEDIFNEDF